MEKLMQMIHGLVICTIIIFDTTSLLSDDIFSILKLGKAMMKFCLILYNEKFYPMFHKFWLAQISLGKTLYFVKILLKKVDLC